MNTETLRLDLHEFVFNCFKYLVPLSYTFKHVTCNKDDEIIIKEWIIYKPQGCKIGSPVIQCTSFFDIIRKYGKLMKPLVRESIAEEFSTLVDLTAELEPYNNMLLKVDVPRLTTYRCCPFRDEDDNKIEVVTLELKTDDPTTLTMYGSDGRSHWKDLTNPLTPMVMEDLVDYAVELYRDAEAKLIGMIKHNNEVTKKMQEVIAPFVVAKEVGR